MSAARSGHASRVCGRKLTHRPGGDTLEVHGLHLLPYRRQDASQETLMSGRTTAAAISSVRTLKGMYCVGFGTNMKALSRG